MGTLRADVLPIIVYWGIADVVGSIRSDGMDGDFGWAPAASVGSCAAGRWATSGWGGEGGGCKSKREDDGGELHFEFGG